EAIRKFDHVLTPGRYVGAADVEDDGVSFEEKFAGLNAKLDEQFDNSKQLEALVKKQLGMISE
ncbi:SAM-dependent DNA methyltransferase, partial [Bacillus sp. SIMBA_161]